MKNYFLFLFILFLSSGHLHSQDSEMAIPADGAYVPELSSFDNGMLSFMKKYKIPGGQLSVMKNGKIVYSRAFGYSDLKKSIPVKTTDLMRIASNSKPITGVAILKLIEEGRLKYDDKAFDILSNLTPPPGRTVIDKRIYDITVRMLLEHTAGWTWENGDPQYKYSRYAADILGKPRPGIPEDIIRVVMSEKLDYTPGTKNVYSNLGYNILARIIERISGKKYEEYVKEKILKPAGITDMHLGKTKKKDLRSDEVFYYGITDNDLKWSVFDDDTLQVTDSYGGDYVMELMDGHGGWISTTDDLVKFINSTDPKTNGTKILKPETVSEMIKPDYPNLNPRQGKAWDIEGNGQEWIHAGGIYGSGSYMSRNGNTGVTYAVTFNLLDMENMDKYYPDIFKVMIPDALSKVTKWPE